MHTSETFDVVVVGGGPPAPPQPTPWPSGAFGAVAGPGWPYQTLRRRDPAAPDQGLRHSRSLARRQGPLGAHDCTERTRVDIPIDNGFVGMVDRADFDEWLRVRAADAGAVRRIGTFEKLSRDADGVSVVHYQARAHSQRGEGTPASVRARTIIGADGAKSQVARQAGVPGAVDTQYVFAYHEIVKAPAIKPAGYDGTRCDVYYQGKLSPDFYGWVFPHGETLSIGTGSADKGFSLRNAVGVLRDAAGLGQAEVLRREGAPLPMKPLKRWDNGRDVVLAGDAAGVVAPASGEGIYYAMYGGELAAHAVEKLLHTGEVKSLLLARKEFMKAHRTVFTVLGIMQWFWYRSEKRRERFVKICEDRDVQQLTFESYMNKQLVRKKPMAHVRIFFKDMAHLLGLAKV